MYRRSSILFILLTLLLSSCKTDESYDHIIPVIEKAINDTSSIYYTDFTKYAEDISALPIGVYDGGIEGIAVVDRFLSIDEYDNITGEKKKDGIKDFAGEDFVFVTDQANSPYGDYLDRDRREFLRELIISNALFLMNNKFYRNYADNERSGMKDGVKVIVVASTTAEANGASDIQDLLKMSGTGVRMVGVVESAVDYLVNHLDKNANAAVGIVSPDTTGRSPDLYIRSIASASEKKGFAGKIDAFTLAEEDGRPADLISYIETLCEKHRRSGSYDKIKSIILPMHYDVALDDTLHQVINQLRMDGCNIDDDFFFLDPGHQTAAACYRLLRSTEHLALNVRKSGLKAYISVPAYEVDMRHINADGTFKDAFKYGRGSGMNEITYKFIPFSSRSIDCCTEDRLKLVAPISYGYLKKKI